MPNSANRNSSGGNANQGQPKHTPAHNDGEKPNPERSDLKQGEHHKDHQGDTGRSSSQGRKEASGGSLEE